MLYGISVSLAGPSGGDPRAMAELAAEAEQAGWDGVRQREHIRSVAEAGATWWNEWVQPGDSQRTLQAVKRCRCASTEAVRTEPEPVHAS